MKGEQTVQAQTPARGTLPQAVPVAFLPESANAGHSRDSVRALAARIARLLDRPFMEVTYPLQPQRCYVVPGTTLVGQGTAGPLGIAGEADLFGGVVPHAVLAGKAITHALLDEQAARPAGWAPAFGSAIAQVVLRGFSAFDISDARRAGRQLLEVGRVRLKPGWTDGGHGQAVVDSPQVLDDALDRLDPHRLSSHGLVLEEEVIEDFTFSIGRVRIGDMVLSYVGGQSVTSNNAGGRAYGGSTLTVVRGPLEQLFELPLDDLTRRAIGCAIAYDSASLAHLTGLIASRRNYDVICGRRPSGEACLGVLEQSWRIGGASGAEIAAFEALHADPRLAGVQTACVERYGPPMAPPADGFIYFQGEDPELGPLTKYATVIQRYPVLGPHTSIFTPVNADPIRASPPPGVS